MPIFETTSLDSGVVNLVPTKGVGGGAMPATVVTTAANSVDYTGQKVQLTGAMEDIEYTVVSPPTQIDGSTSASGSYVVTVTFFAQDGSTSLGTVVSPSVACSQTVNGASVGTVYTLRLALANGAPGANVTQTATPNLRGATISVPRAATFAQAAVDVTGTVGALTSGWTLGGHRRNRAG